MIKKFKFFKYISFFSLAFFSFSLFAYERAYVFCYSPNEDTWQWLKNSSGDRIELEGYWKKKKFGRYSFSYFFLVDRNKSYINYLKKLCTDQFGQNYFVAQPAKTSLLNHSWDVFSLSDDKFLNSKMEIRYKFENSVFRPTDNCVIKIPYDSNRSKYLNENDIKNLVKNKVC
ncbi:hypothetical protein [Fluviispira vulneris]|uniref:hypothetical protein n=1 Tax=Fluviispira vulneris TaxID=2763012 RepID=UPI0016462BC5|nr:hypothetical protein [Fluviispira vulneris]